MYILSYNILSDFLKSKNSEGVILKAVMELQGHLSTVETLCGLHCSLTDSHLELCFFFF